MSDKTCPTCGLSCAAWEVRCDCGYAYPLTQLQMVETQAYEVKRSSCLFIILGAFIWTFGTVCLVILTNLGLLPAAIARIVMFVWPSVGAIIIGLLIRATVLRQLARKKDMLERHGPVEEGCGFHGPPS